MLVLPLLEVICFIRNHNFYNNAFEEIAENEKLLKQNKARGFATTPCFEPKSCKS